MELKKRGREVLSEAAEIFDLPEDVVAGLCRIEVIGTRQLYMENHRGILSYSGETIDVSARGVVLRVWGAELELVSMTASALRIRGDIQRVEWVK